MSSLCVGQLCCVLCWSVSRLWNKYNLKCGPHNLSFILVQWQSDRQRLTFQFHIQIYVCGARCQDIIALQNTATKLEVFFWRLKKLHSVNFIRKQWLSEVYRIKNNGDNKKNITLMSLTYENVSIVSSEEHFVLFPLKLNQGSHSSAEDNGRICNQAHQRSSCTLRWAQ